MRRALVVALVAGLALAAAPTPAAAQASARQLSGIELGRSLSGLLQQIQETWLQWMSAFYQDRREDADRAVGDLRAALAVTGLRKLPDLAIGAAARAVESARQGNLERAAWGLEAAESLDPGRPETSFARSIWAWESGAYPTAVVAQIQGYLRTLDLRLYRAVLLHNLLLGVAAVALVAGAAFVLLLGATRGPALFQDLQAALAALPGPARALGAAALLVWPIVLPGGPAWLLLYLSVLLWAYAGMAERAVLALVWIVLGLAPVAVDRGQREITVLLSPPSQAVQALAEGRLYGELFTDLGVLRTVLPEEPAVRELLADVNRMTGQWELARDSYEEILATDPENVPILLNLGAYYFRKGDYGSAVRYFQRAAAVDPENPATYYNLSQAYSESYLFDEQKTALSRAQELDDDRVNAWIRQPGEERVVTVSGGLQREKEIQAALERIWGPEGSSTLPVRTVLSLVLPVVALALAVVFSRVRPRAAAPAPSAEVASDPRTDAFVGWLVPGLPSLEAGRGVRAYLALAAVSLFLVAGFSSRIGLALPWGIAPGHQGALAFSALGLLTLYGSRGWMMWRGRA